MTPPLDLAAVRARHDVFETYLQQMPHHAAAVTLDLRVRTLHADRAALLAALDAAIYERESLRMERDAICTTAQRDNEYLIGQRDDARAALAAAQMQERFGTPFDPTGAKTGTEINSLRQRVEELLAALDARTAEATRLRDRCEERALELEQAREAAERPKCAYCAFGETERVSMDALTWHVEKECGAHPIAKLLVRVAELEHDRDELMAAMDEHEPRIQADRAALDQLKIDAASVQAALDRLAAVTVEEVAWVLADFTQDTGIPPTVTRIERDAATAVLGLIRERVEGR